jgi:transcriptional regulator
MYRLSAHAIDDMDVLHSVMRARGFATIAAVVDGSLQFAYAPMVVDPEPKPYGAVRFHLARANPLAGLDGEELRFSFLGPDAYLSPDWYETKGLVPTWNYIAVEGAGRVRRLDENELRQLLVDLSSSAEEKLRPKPPWTFDKIPGDRLPKLLAAIRGFAVSLDVLEGKFKLLQGKSPADVARAIAGLEARGDPASLAVAQAMKEARPATAP